jgi:hypothetical protein
MTCPYCGYNTSPRGPMPRTAPSLRKLEERERRRAEEEAELRDFFDLDDDN